MSGGKRRRRSGLLDGREPVLPLIRSPRKTRSPGFGWGGLGAREIGDPRRVRAVDPAADDTKPQVAGGMAAWRSAG